MPETLLKLIRKMVLQCEVLENTVESLDQIWIYCGRMVLVRITEGVGDFYESHFLQKREN